MSAFIVGSTGLCGNFILKYSPEFYSNVYSLSRSTPDNSSDPKIHAITEKDSTKWAAEIAKIEGPVDTFFSGLGTTRAAAGGLDKQYLIDHDLNLELAKAAKERGFKKYVLISSGHASSASMFPYMRMKGELEDAVLALNFDQTIILQPGILLGERKQTKGFGNIFAAAVSSWAEKTPFSKYMGSPIQGEDVALAALKLAAQPSEEKVRVVVGTDLYDYAKK